MIQHVFNQGESSNTAQPYLIIVNSHLLTDILGISSYILIAMSSPSSVAQRLQKLQLQQQEDIDDVDVEDTIVSPLVNDGA